MYKAKLALKLTDSTELANANRLASVSSVRTIQGIQINFTIIQNSDSEIFQKQKIQKYIELTSLTIGLFSYRLMREYFS